MKKLHIFYVARRSQFAKFLFRPVLAPFFGLLFSVGFFAVPSAQAASIFWKVPTGNWDVGTNWFGNVVPTTNDQAYVTNGTALVPAGVSAAAITAHVGYGGANGALTISGGTLSGSVILGESAGLSGTANISSGLCIGPTLYVGQSGTGILNLTGGAISNTTSGFSYIGVSSGSSGTATVSGGTWTSPSLFVGHVGNGTLNLYSGTISNTTFIIGNATSSGGIVTQTGGTLTTTAAYLGASGTATVNLDGGNFYDASANLGYQSNGVGTVTVSSGAAWTNSNALNVGAAGSGTLNVSGGTVVALFATLGSSSGSSGNANVNSGTWITKTNLVIGSAGTGTLQLVGGTVDSRSSTLAQSAGVTGTAIVSGGLWTNSSSLTVGNSGNGTLTVSGGMVTAPSVYTGSGPGSIGSISLTGSAGNRGILAVSQVLEGSGTGTLTFDGGVLQATANQSPWLSGFEDGDVIINSGGAFIDSGGYNVSINNLQLQGTGGLTKLGAGTLTLGIQPTYAGGTVVEGGTLAVNTTIPGPVVVSGGTLGGTGTVDNVTIAANGIISPGNSVGTLNTKSETWEGSSTYRWEISNATSSPGVGWDNLAINGDLTITASAASPMTIKLHSLNGSSPGPAANFNGLTNGSWVMATYSGTLTGFAPEKFVVDASNFSNSYNGTFTVTNPPGEIRLLFTKSAPPIITPQVTTGDPQQIYYNTAIVHGDINPNGLSATARVEFGPTMNYGFTTTPYPLSSGTNSVGVDFTLPFLLTGTTYYYRVTASNVNGVVYGATKTVTTFSQPTLIDIVRSGDPAGGTSANSPAGQFTTNIFDNFVTNKYLNFDKLNAGFVVIPSGNRAVTALTFISAEDEPARDPSSYKFEGSYDNVNYTLISSNSLAPFSDRSMIQTVNFANDVAYPIYRVLFPTISNAPVANSMQIAEVEFLPWRDITSTNDTVTASLQIGAIDVRGFRSVLDKKLGVTNKLEIQFTGPGGLTTINITPSIGSTVLKGFEMIGATDDLTYPERRPSSVLVSGSNDGNNYYSLCYVSSYTPNANSEIREYLVTNTVAYAQYRVTFGNPVDSDRLQVGEIRLFGETFVPSLSISPGGNQVKWPHAAGFYLEYTTNLNGGTWISNDVAPTFANNTNTVAIPVNSAEKFLRLHHP